MAAHLISSPRRPRRVLALITSLLAAAGLVLFAPAAMACGYGGAVSESRHRTAVDREAALLTSDGI
jgi:hypothetical protein